MKFDFHCHTRNGSLDARVDVLEYAKLLKEKGFAGMMVTDHNSYRGYREWLRMREETDGLEGFTVLRGIEYDTLDAGHILVVMPDEIELQILEVRGLLVRQLAKIVHQHGGILGPAHPYGAKFLSAMCSKRLEREPELIHEFDFVEAFNTCELPESNRKAAYLAARYGKACFGGSDSHKIDYIGMAYTEISEPVACADDLIRLVKEGRIDGCGGQERKPKERTPAWAAIIGAGWKIYNRGVAAARCHARKLGLQEAGFYS
ncbi:MAG: PHP domain-containing protein [Lachnospiraceae bacterium]|nr:PHP domain-containing protein [Lachnospiraceae bacterium]